MIRKKLATGGYLVLLRTGSQAVEGVEGARAGMIVHSAAVFRDGDVYLRNAYQITKRVIAGTDLWHVRPLPRQVVDQAAGLETDKHKVFRSLYGAKKREQTRLTPTYILDAIEQVWPEGIEMDPCSAPGSLVQARVAYDGVAGRDGLAVDWPDRTFANPPYDTLKKWVGKPRYGCEHMMLVPVRTQRWYWRDAALTTSLLCWLDPVVFVGFRDQYPAPCAMMYWGRRRLRFLRAFAKIGEVTAWHTLPLTRVAGDVD